MNALERMRLDRRWSRAELASRSGVGDKTIRQIEEHGQEPQVATIAKLADAFEITPSELVRQLRESGREAAAA